MKPNAKLDITIDNSSDPKGDPIEFRIEDRASGEFVAIFELTPAQVLAALAGRHLAKVDGWITPPGRRDRLGRKLSVQTVQVPTDVACSREDEDKARAWARSEVRLRGLDESEVRLTNHGWEAVLRDWRDA